jgi:hypothetical protein
LFRQPTSSSLSYSPTSYVPHVCQVSDLCLQEKESSLTARLNGIYNRRQFRRTEGALIVQGAKNIQLLLEHKIHLSKLAVTVPDAWQHESQILSPSIDVIRHPEDWPAEEYLANTVHCVRKIMGGQASPGHHELWAEVAVKDLPATRDWPSPGKDKVHRLLVTESIRSDRDVGELVRTARGLAWDAGLFIEGGQAGSTDFWSPLALRASRLQTLFFPSRSATVNDAVEQSKKFGCTNIVLRPLPESQLENSIVGVPHFWRENGEAVDLEELQGKSVCLFVSQHENHRAFENDIRLSLPVAQSPNSAYDVPTTLPLVQAASLAMQALLQVTQGVKVGQPTGLRMTTPEEMEGNALTKKVAKILHIPRPRTPRQQVMHDKKKKRYDFMRDWHAAEENWEGWEPEQTVGEELVPGKMGAHAPRQW